VRLVAMEVRVANLPVVQRRGHAERPAIILRSDLLAGRQVVIALQEGTDQAAHRPSPDSLPGAFGQPRRGMKSSAERRRRGRYLSHRTILTVAVPP
jgi:hypothetical protein